VPVASFHLLWIYAIAAGGLSLVIEFDVVEIFLFSKILEQRLARFDRHLWVEVVRHGDAESIATHDAWIVGVLRTIDFVCPPGAGFGVGTLSSRYTNALGRGALALGLAEAPWLAEQWFALVEVRLLAAEVECDPNRARG